MENKIKSKTGLIQFSARLHGLASNSNPNVQNQELKKDDDQFYKQLIKVVENLKAIIKSLDNIIVFNVGYEWPSDEYYMTFENRVVEIPVCLDALSHHPMYQYDALFGVCKCAFEWMKCSLHNHVFIQVHGCVDSSSEILIYIVKSFQIYCITGDDFDSWKKRVCAKSAYGVSLKNPSNLNKCYGIMNDKDKSHGKRNGHVSHLHSNLTSIPESSMTNFQAISSAIDKSNESKVQKININHNDLFKKNNTISSLHPINEIITNDANLIQRQNDNDEGDAPVTPKKSEENHPLRHNSTSSTNNSSTSTTSINKNKPNKKRPPPPPPPPPLPPKNKLISSSISIKSKSQKNSKKEVRSFYWNKMEKSDGTVWNELPSVLTFPKPMKKMLKTLFHKTPDKINPVQNKEISNTRVDITVSNRRPVVIDDTRGNNISIMMKCFSDFPGGVNGICRAVLSGEGLVTDELGILIQVAPKEEEIKGIMNTKFEMLSMPERTLFTMSFVPRLRLKCQCRLAMDLWETRKTLAHNIFDIINESIREIRDSIKLKTVFEAVLMVGNTMNKGTDRGNASGATIDSLNKLKDTRITGYNPNNKAISSSNNLISEVFENMSHNSNIENHITNLLDFTVLIMCSHEINSKEKKRKDKNNEGYLMKEMNHLKEAVRCLEDGIADMIKEIDSSFIIIEDEITYTIGKSSFYNYNEDNNELRELILKKSHNGTKSTYLELEVRFLHDICNFMIESTSERQILNEKKNHVEKALNDLIKWLGASTKDTKAKMVLKNFLDFVKDFDKAYNDISALLSTY